MQIFIRIFAFFITGNLFSAEINSTGNEDKK